MWAQTQYKPIEQNGDLLMCSVVLYGITKMDVVSKRTTKQIKHRRACLLYAGLHNDLTIYYNRQKQSHLRSTVTMQIYSWGQSFLSHWRYLYCTSIHCNYKHTALAVSLSKSKEQPFVCSWLFVCWCDVYFQFCIYAFFPLNLQKWSLNDKRVLADQRKEDWQQCLETTCTIPELKQFYGVCRVSVYPQKLTGGNKQKFCNSCSRRSV